MMIEIRESNPILDHSLPMEIPNVANMITAPERIAGALRSMADMPSPRKIIMVRPLITLPRPLITRAGIAEKTPIAKPLTAR